MGLFSKKTKVKLNEAPATINKNNYKNFAVKAVSLIKGVSDTREQLTAPEYNLLEIKHASEADSYIKMAIMKYSYMLFKAGYILKSENEKATEYIKSRFYIMSFATGKPIDVLFQEVGDDLIKYSNAFLVKSRVNSIMPGIKAIGFLNNKPVGGYFRIDPSTISIVRDKNGTIKKYVQTVDGEEKSFMPTEILHFYLDKEAANAFGTPRIIAALEDVKLLRRVEGNVTSMIYRFAMPLYQWIVGLPQTGFQATNKEIDEVKDEIENMSLDGSVVTNEKTSIKVIGAEGSALNAESYLKYFEQRVFSALGVSESQMGRGGAKQDADSMESQAHDTVKHIQRMFSIFVENGIINELLLEGGFNPILNEDDRVNFVFNEINIETKIKVENHEMLKFQSNMISFEEMRREIGKREEIDEDRLYKNMIEVKAQEQIAKCQGDESIRIQENSLDLQLRNSKELAKQAQDAAKEQSKLNNSNNNNNTDGSGSQGNSPKGNGTTKTSKNNSLENKNRPENQHGKTSVKVKESLDIAEKTIRNKAKHEKTFDDIYNSYKKLGNDIAENPEDIELLLPLGLDNLLAKCKVHMQEYSLKGSNESTKDIKKLLKNNKIAPSVSVSLTQFEEEAKTSLKKTLKDIKKKIGDTPDKKHIEAVFEAMQYRIRFMLEYIMPKVYWFSYLKTGEAFGYKKAYIDFGDSDDAKYHKQTIDLNALNIDDVPPFHPFCDCEIIFKKGDKK